VPRSHTCPSCLYELARIRAVPDVHYGLGVVVCPRCQNACVRARHPDHAFWRSFRRVYQSLRLLFVTLIVTVLVGLGTWGMVTWADDLFTSSQRDIELFSTLKRGDLSDFLAIWVMLGVMVIGGCLIRLVYWHKSFITAILMFLIPAAFFSSIDITTGIFFHMYAAIFSFDPPNHFPSQSDIALRAQYFGAVSIIALIGLATGSLLRPFFMRAPLRKFRRNRRTLQRRRTRTD
jgi:hypothetical protein